MSPHTIDAISEFIRQLSSQQFALMLAGLAIPALGCLYLGFRWLQRARMIADLATSKVRSAAQGYVELEGRAKMMPGEPVYAPLSGVPCTWYSYKVEQQGRGADGRSDGWSIIEQGISEAIFHLQDETGMCIVDPDGAEVTPSVRLCWRGQSSRPIYAPRATGFWSQLFSFGPYRYTEWRIHPHDRLYATGQFISVGEGLSYADQTRDLLSTWKRDRVGLLKRFDANSDGALDLQEWELARQMAEQEVIASAHTRRTEQPVLSLLKKPSHGQPFILSCIPQMAMISRYRWKACLGLLSFLAIGITLSWSINIRLGSQPSKPLERLDRQAVAFD